MVAADLDDDGWSDLFVAAYGAANRLFLNNGDGSFREQASEAVNNHGRAWGVAVGDVDNDGDLVILQMSRSTSNGTSSLMRNVQVGRSFAETAGTIAHEIGHLLGLPDLFATAWLRAEENSGPEGDSAGIGRWGLMGWGALGWNGTAGPTSLSGWSRRRLGWLPVFTVDQTDQEIALGSIPGCILLRG